MSPACWNESYKKYDSHDVLLYVVLKKTNDQSFRLPFDGMFTGASTLPGYGPESGNPLETEFALYLKTGDWANTLGLTKEAAATLSFLHGLVAAWRAQFK